MGPSVGNAGGFVGNSPRVLARYPATEHLLFVTATGRALPPTALRNKCTAWADWQHRHTSRRQCHPCEIANRLLGSLRQIAGARGRHRELDVLREFIGQHLVRTCFQAVQRAPRAEDIGFKMRCMTSSLSAPRKPPGWARQTRQPQSIRIVTIVWFSS